MYILTLLVMTFISGIWAIYSRIWAESESCLGRRQEKKDLKYIQEHENEWINSSLCPIKRCGEKLICQQYRDISRTYGHFNTPFEVHYGYDEGKRHYGILDSDNKLCFSYDDVEEWKNFDNKYMYWMPAKEGKVCMWYKCSKCGYKEHFSHVLQSYGCCNCHRRNRAL